eukprot:scaffold4223_cov189-Amphora_coffeaeformis.AAC.59
MKAESLSPIGVSLDGPPSTDADWARIPALMRQGHGVLVVNNLDVNGRQLETLLQNFALKALGHALLTYDRWPGQSPRVKDCPHLALLGNYKYKGDEDATSNIIEHHSDGGDNHKIGECIAEYKPATLDLSEWHTDGSFLARPKTYIALYAPQQGGALPEEGGQTRFCSTRISKQTADKYKNWTSVHSWETFMRFLEHRDPKRPKVTPEQCQAKPDQTWKLVQKRYHEEDQEMQYFLYINPKNTKAVYNDKGQAVDNPTEFIYQLAQDLLRGGDDNDGDVILKNDTDGVYWHQWQKGQLVLWDNAVLLHAATPFDATKYERLLYRAEFGPHYVPCRPSTAKWGYMEAAGSNPASLPVATYPSGSVVTVDTVMGSIEPPAQTIDSGATTTFTNIPPELYEIRQQVNDRVGPHILTGPIAIEGARPGQVLQVDILKTKLRSDWAYTIHKFSSTNSGNQPQVRHTKLLPYPGDGVAVTPWGSRLECRPFFGILATAPPRSKAAGDRVSSIPPHAAYGGNLDLRLLTAGSTLYLPIHQEGAMLYVGDGHARQGDGECCGTALETSLTGTFRLTVRDDMPWSTVVRAETPHSMIGIGVEKSVDHAIQSSLTHLVDWMLKTPQCAAMSRVDCECLCSIAADIAVTQVVNGSTRGAHVILQKEQLPSPPSS